MLHQANRIAQYGLHTNEGPLGRAIDLLFDEQEWQIRYLVADTEGLFERKVLLAFELLGSPNHSTGEIPVFVSQDKIRNSLGLESEKSVSRDQEMQNLGYHSLAPYWGVAGNLAAAGIYPADMAGSQLLGDVDSHGKEDEAALWGALDVTGYTVAATDGILGQVDDFLIDGETWKIRFIVVDIRKGVPDGIVVLPLDVMEEIDRSERQIRVNVDKDAISTALRFDQKVTDEDQYLGALRRLEAFQQRHHNHGKD